MDSKYWINFKNTDLVYYEYYDKEDVLITKSGGGACFANFYSLETPYKNLKKIILNPPVNIIGFKDESIERFCKLLTEINLPCEYKGIIDGKCVFEIDYELYNHNRSRICSTLTLLRTLWAGYGYVPDQAMQFMDENPEMHFFVALQKAHETDDFKMIDKGINMGKPYGGAGHICRLPKQVKILTKEEYEQNCLHPNTFYLDNEEHNTYNTLVLSPEDQYGRLRGITLYTFWTESLNEAFPIKEVLGEPVKEIKNNLFDEVKPKIAKNGPKPIINEIGGQIPPGYYQEIKKNAVPVYKDVNEVHDLLKDMVEDLFVAKAHKGKPPIEKQEVKEDFIKELNDNKELRKEINPIIAEPFLDPVPQIGGIEFYHLNGYENINGKLVSKKKEVKPIVKKQLKKKVNEKRA